MKHSSVSPCEFLGPRYWPIWLLAGGLRLFVALGHRWRLGLGRFCGRALMPMFRTRRHNADRNLALCFPELPFRSRRRLLDAHAASLGIALIESAMAWWLDDRLLSPLVRVEGLEHLHEARRRGRGALLVAAHFTPLEIGARLLAMQVPLDVVYQPHSNPLVEALLRSGRGRRVERLIRNDQPRELLRRLRAGAAVWFAPDQTYPPASSVLAPFFAVPAMTNTTALKLAARSGALVLPYFVERVPDGDYRILVEPAVDVPGEVDPTAAARRLNQLVEAQIRRRPEQYLWIHRRFRRYQPDYPDYYAPR